ncbi:hypothetical protein [Myxococcus sp. RHSTA-1-4]|uniref:hypothetical protein n=1 Tax=Myxococcus sp. RHSTA-1-4 TaxID=2874601 RepID=UPI001CC05623|nr:hypothetical protein [Myxococcus sp. RHSTA-1-4]MBZ4417633.1 hypothetical protein [Myxococcus sp. RHSTA-1-4]
MLRQLDGEFHSRVLGDASLRLLLARFPDLGHVAGDTVSKDFRFFFNGAAPLLPGGEGTRTPSAEANARMGPAEADPVFWGALTHGSSTEAVYVDLHTQHVVSAALSPEGQPGAPVSEEPERYLRVAVIPEEHVRDEAHALVEKAGSEETRESLSRALARGVDSFESAIKGSSLEEQWRQAFHRCVVAHAHSWLAAHGLQPGRFFRVKASAPVRKPPQQNMMRQPRTALLTGSQLRRLILEAVRRMPEEDLLNLQIPLKYLVDTQAAVEPSPKLGGETLPQ